MGAARTGTRGTLIVGEEELEDMERQLITGIAHDKNEAKITLVGVLDKPGSVAAIFGPLADAGINVDMIVQNVAHAGSSTDVTFTVPAADLPRSIEVLTVAKEMIGFSELTHDTRVSAKCPWSAWACAATPASPRRCSRRWANAASTFR